MEPRQPITGNVPPAGHNQPDQAEAYESALKQVLADKVRHLPLKDAALINDYVNFVMEKRKAEAAEKQAPYGEWTDDELRILSLMSLQRAYAEEDEDLISPQAMRDE